MITRIVRIGNAHVVRVPKRLLDLAGLSGEVQIQARNGTLIIGRAKKPREGWDESFKQMVANGDDKLIDS